MQVGSASGGSSHAPPDADVRSSDDTPGLSVVIPVFNEAGCLRDLHRELVGVLEDAGIPFEVIFVDDGSADETPAILAELHKADPRTRVIVLKRNFGQTPALSAGFDAARGELVVTMDGDLQNDPRDITRLIDVAASGFDVVSGWRVDRKDVWYRRVSSRIANRLIGLVTGVRIHDYGCAMKLYRADVVKSLRLYGELHRFLPAIARSQGARVGETAVNHRPRSRGDSKYAGLAATTRRTVKVLLDLIAVTFLHSYSTRPLHVFGSLGFLMTTLGGAIALYLTVLKLFFGQPLGGRPLLSLAVLMIIVGVQFVSIGLLSELVVRTYHESQGKPIYSVRRVLDRAPDARDERS